MNRVVCILVMVASVSTVFFCACKKDTPSPANKINTNSNITNTSSCSATQVSNSAGCMNANLVSGPNGLCCPIAYPYYCTNGKSSSCYATCEEAAAVCGGTNIAQGCTGACNSSSNNNNSNSTNYGSGPTIWLCSLQPVYDLPSTMGGTMCGSGQVYVGGGKCCPENNPYYCTSTNQCFSDCKTTWDNCSKNFSNMTWGVNQ